MSRPFRLNSKFFITSIAPLHVIIQTMQLLHDPIKLHLSQVLNKILGEQIKLDEYELYHALVEPPQFEMGQLAFPCFNLAKSLRKSPLQIAAGLVDKIT